MDVVAEGNERTALYRLYDETGKLLYVGITCNPEARFAQHKADKHWWWQVTRREVEWFNSRINAAAAEEVAIKVKDPVYNCEHSRRRLTVRVTVELAEAHVMGMNMLLRGSCNSAYDDVLRWLLDRELDARGLTGNPRCFHGGGIDWPDGVKVVAGDEGICPCGVPILPNGRPPEDYDGRAA